MRARSLLLLVALALAVPPGARAAGPGPVAQDRSVEPVVLRGSQFPTWSAGPDPTFHEPGVPTNYDTADIQGALPAPLRSDCYKPGTGQNPYDPNDNGDHNCYQESRLPRNPIEGPPVGRILGYRWDGSAYVQIPFQVDERFTRYLSNNYSDFAFYSNTDAHNTYAFDREGFRYTWDASKTDSPPGNPCLTRPKPGSTIVNGYATMLDPVKGLDDDDELAFMWDDAGARAPETASLPAQVEGAYEIRVDDPSDPSNVRYTYVMLASSHPDAPRPAFDATNGYVRYARDANTIPPAPGAPPSAEMFVYSQSGNSGYGTAPKGPYCRLDGTLDTSRGPIAQRRPLDGAWVRTPRYWFRYDGRWLMTQLRVSPNDSGLSANPVLGPDLIDQWKARAFQQRPGGQTPCCGYEEEVRNWGGSSILLGERWGPVRAIRATWGADSSTNNVRIETLYRDEIRFGDALRVHPIPPLDGIYVQWDYNAAKVSTYYNPLRPDGVPIDGRNDEVFGNAYVHVAGDKVQVRDDDPIPVVGPINVEVPLGGEYNDCRFNVGSERPRSMCNDIDLPDPTFSGPVGNLNWEQVSGPYGSIVTRWTIKEHTAGDAYSLLAQPYYRDDACFDDGTGNDPGPHLKVARTDAGPADAGRGETYLGDASRYLDPSSGLYLPRVCWTPADGDPAADPAGPRRFWQGDIATHGLHLQVIGDTDNASLTVPVDEVVTEQRMVVLRGMQPNVGETYGRHVEYPLTATAAPLVR